MAANEKSTYIPYVPGSPPTQTPDTVRATWDEFFRIASSLIDLDRPVSLSITESETLAVSTNPAFNRMFDGNITAEWEQPGGAFDRTTGIYTFPQEGLYNMYVRLNVPPFTTPATKSYKAEIRATIDYITAGQADTVWLLESGGLDDQYLTVQGQSLYPLRRGDKIYFDARAIHATKTGTIAITATLQIQRVSGIV